jgi:hypothetical protein
MFLSLVAPASFCGAADELQDKSRYNLFHRTPDNLLRELATDRPDKTESPTTVDAGHFQIEMDFATFTQDQMNGVNARTWNIAPFNLRVGLLNDVELSLVFESYLQEDTEDKTAKKVSNLSGVGNFITRLKVNLWGNDGGRTAFALFPFMKFPTGTGGLNNSSIEGGAIFLFSMTLPATFELGMQTGVVVLRNESGANYREEFVNSITFAREIAGKWLLRIFQQRKHRARLELDRYCRFWPHLRAYGKCSDRLWLQRRSHRWSRRHQRVHWPQRPFLN